MTDDIREKAIEAACVEFTRGDMPSWRRWEEDERNETREAMARAIAAYERAMWRPEGEAEPEVEYLVQDRMGVVAFAELHPEGEWIETSDMLSRRHIVRFRPLPLPPEDEA